MDCALFFLTPLHKEAHMIGLSKSRSSFLGVLENKYLTNKNPEGGDPLMGCTRRSRSLRRVEFRCQCLLQLSIRSGPPAHSSDAFAGALIA